MKRFLIVALVLLMPQVQNAMEEKPEMTQEEAEGLWWNTALPQPDPETGKPRPSTHEEYKENLSRAISNGSTVQHHYHNPLLNAVFEGDYDFAKFLLEHGASPTFSGMNRMSGYDALSLIDSKIYDNPDAIKRFKSLLDSYLKPGEQITPYSGGSGNYRPNRALNN